MPDVSDQQQFVAEHNESDAVAVLKLALNETQQSIRSYDTKAQICAIGYLFTLNIVLAINTMLFPESEPDIWAVMVGWCVLIFPMLLFGYVLYPTRKSILPDESEETKNIQKVLYIRQERYSSVKQIAEAVLRSNIFEELVFELYQASDLRDRKRIRFVRALVFSFLALVTMFCIHLTAVLAR